MDSNVFSKLIHSNLRSHIWQTAKGIMIRKELEFPSPLVIIRIVGQGASNFGMTFLLLNVSWVPDIGAFPFCFSTGSALCAPPCTPPPTSPPHFSVTLSTGPSDPPTLFEQTWRCFKCFILKVNFYLVQISSFPCISKGKRLNFWIATITVLELNILTFKINKVELFLGLCVQRAFSVEMASRLNN